MAYLLTLVTFLPGLGALVVLALPRRQESAIRYVTLLATVVAFLVSLPLYFSFDASIADYQFVASNTPEGCMPKVAIPSPTMAHFRGGRAGIMPGMTPMRVRYSGNGTPSLVFWRSVSS